MGETKMMHTVRLPLKTNRNTEHVMEKRFRLIQRIHNQMVKHAKHLLTKLHKDQEYIELMVSYGEIKEKADNGDAAAKKRLREIRTRLNAICQGIGLTKNAFDSYVSHMQHKYKKNIHSHQAQVEAERVWKGVESVLFHDGKDVHYKKGASFRTIRGKNHSTGIVLYQKGENDYFIKWNKLIIPVKTPRRARPDLPSGKNYLQEAFADDKIVYCEIVRLWFKSGWRYYVNVYLSGTVPQKIVPGKSVMGIDEGTSTVAAVSETSVILEELAPCCRDYNARIAQLQRQVDISTRITNPLCFHKDGTAKKRKDRIGVRWVFSKSCLRKKAEIRELYRKKSEYITHCHGAVVNQMIKDSSVFVLEPMDFKALAKKAKQTKRQDKASCVKQKDGSVKSVYKYKKKKRFGKSISDRGPAELIQILERKCSQYGLLVYEVDKWEYRASQYDHVTNKYRKSPLSQRMKCIGGHIVQRDLYSAFLLSCREHEKKPDRAKCKRLFHGFVEQHDLYINDRKAKGISRPACFGF